MSHVIYHLSRMEWPCIGVTMHVTATQGIFIYVLPKQYNKTILLS